MAFPPHKTYKYIHIFPHPTLYSNPTPRGDAASASTDANDSDVRGGLWTPATRFPLDYLRIGNKDDHDAPLIAMESGLMEERAMFWRKLQAHAAARVDTALKTEL